MSFRTWTFSAILIAFAATSAHATSIRFVSTNGTNTGDCIAGHPCRTLTYAIGKVPARGELRVLNSGFYGASATIDRQITLDGGGNTVDGLALKIDKPNGVVSLRNLSLNGNGTVNYGIDIVEAAAVHIERCTVFGYAFTGIFAEGGGAHLFLSDTISRDNQNYGVVVQNGAALTAGDSHFENNKLIGLYIYNAVATGTRVTSAKNGAYGYSVAGPGAQLGLESSLAQANATYGLVVGNGALARVSNSTFTGNGTGIIVNLGGTMLTRQNNTVSGNTQDISNSGTITPLAAQ